MTHGIELLNALHAAELAQAGGADTFAAVENAAKAHHVDPGRLYDLLLDKLDGCLRARAALEAERALDAVETEADA